VARSTVGVTSCLCRNGRTRGIACRRRPSPAPSHTISPFMTAAKRTGAAKYRWSAGPPGPEVAIGGRRGVLYSFAELSVAAFGPFLTPWTRTLPIRPGGRTIAADFLSIGACH